MTDHNNDDETNTDAAATGRMISFLAIGSVVLYLLLQLLAELLPRIMGYLHSR